MPISCATAATAWSARLDFYKHVHDSIIWPSVISDAAQARQLRDGRHNPAVAITVPAKLQTMHALGTTLHSSDQNGDTGRAHSWIVYIGLLRNNC